MNESKIKIAIPKLTFVGITDISEKQKLVTTWKNKMIAYAKFYKIYSYMFELIPVPEVPGTPFPANRAQYDQDHANDPVYLGQSAAQRTAAYNELINIHNEYRAAMEEYLQKQEQCMAVLSESLDPDLSTIYIDFTVPRTSYVIINQITSQYCRADNVTKSMINDEYDRLSIEGISFDEYVEQLMIVCSRLSGVGTVVTENQKIVKMLNTLFAHRYGIWSQVQAQINPTTMSFDQAKSIIESYVQLQEKRNKNKSHETKKRKILNVNVSGSDGSDKPKRDLSNIKCYNCNKMGHYARDCRSPPRKGKKNNKGSSTKSNQSLKKQIHAILKSIKEEEAENEQEEEKPAKKKAKFEAGGSKVKVNVVIKRKRSPVPVHSVKYARMSSTELQRFDETDNPDVMIDSGANSTVFTKVHPLMDNVKRNTKAELVFAGGEVGIVDATGSIGEMKEIHCSSALAHEIMSVSQLTEMGYTLVFDSNNAFVLKKEAVFEINNEDILMQGVNEDGLYKIPLHTIVQSLINEAN